MNEGGSSRIPRELIWFENRDFAAWGCKACAWIMSEHGPTTSGRPPAAVKEAFDQHECANFPRVPRRRSECTVLL